MLNPADFLAYVGEPTETLARLNSIRYTSYEDMGNSMDYEFAVDDIPSLSSNKEFQQLAAVYGAENVVEMLNEIY